MATQPTILNDFQVFAGANAQYTYGVQNNTSGHDLQLHHDPGRHRWQPDHRHSLFASSGPQPDLVDFLLGGGNNFNYSDFDVFVMIANAPGSGLSDRPSRQCL